MNVHDLNDSERHYYENSLHWHLKQQVLNELYIIKNTWESSIPSEFSPWEKANLSYIESLGFPVEIKEYGQTRELRFDVSKASFDQRVLLFSGRWLKDKNRKR